MLSKELWSSMSSEEQSIFIRDYLRIGGVIGIIGLIVLLMVIL